MLTKRALETYHPAIPGQPFVPDQTICPPPDSPGDEPGGHWEYVCETPTVFVGYDYGPATPDNPGPFPKPIYVTGQPVCYSKWIPDETDPFG